MKKTLIVCLAGASLAVALLLTIHRVTALEKKMENCCPRPAWDETVEQISDELRALRVEDEKARDENKAEFQSIDRDLNEIDRALWALGRDR